LRLWRAHCLPQALAPTPTRPSALFTVISDIRRAGMTGEQRETSGCTISTPLRFS